MAIAYIGSTSSVSSSDSFDAGAGSNSNVILFVSVGNFNQSGSPSVTYNGVSMTFITSANLSGAQYVSLFYLLSPASGSNTISVTNGGSWTAASYSGVKQSGQPDAYNQSSQSGASGTKSLAITTTANNCWAIFVGQYNDANSFTNVTRRQLIAGGQWLADSNSAISPAGSFTASTTISGSQPLVMNLASFSPVASQIKTVSGVAQASISKVSGVTNANIKKLAGVANS